MQQMYRGKGAKRDAGKEKGAEKTDPGRKNKGHLT